MPSAFRRGGTTKKGALASRPSLPKILSPSASSSSSPSLTPINHRNAAASSFRPPRGVKPWQGGTYLTSVGLSDLDNILGGGQLLGSTILLEEDRLWTRDLAFTLMKYWCAEVCFYFLFRQPDKCSCFSIVERSMFTK